MKLARVLLPNQEIHVVVVEESAVRVLDFSQVQNVQRLTDILHSPDPAGLANFLIDTNVAPVAIEEVHFLAPVDQQEVWAAGVTYKRSQQARMEESEHAASHYDLVYSADRPELFFKATAQRVVGHQDPVRVRNDSSWSVPEPEFAIYLTPEMHVCGYTIGNDMSARDIEGENPLYLPQAKVYNQCCSLGPCVTLGSTDLDLSSVEIKLGIERNKAQVFSGETKLDQLNRTLDELASWLGKEMDFPNGAVLLTGTGIIPPDEFTLESGDIVTIEISNIGQLINPVEKG
ncbi:MAG TPA: 2-hydroxyhepta-2,4-diene-1,7-dioate isomerase [Planctomycetaceae bacterium]|nr:2-hydroxyhepta-2,4-diene-1,7-dioate isomerase [Planctomycetaceae bacterium]